jgi:exodeoxyribonuclease VII large subunit
MATYWNQSVSSEYEIELGVSDFVAVANQTLEYAYPTVAIVGELANFRISKNRWVYFDLKDEFASLRFFGTVYQLNSSLEDGMVLRVRGAPRLHPQFGFSITVQKIELVGEGTIKRAASLLEAKLRAEGLFEVSRKRTLPYPPRRIGLIASGESAAYVDFMKIITARWSGLEIVHADVQVQGADAPEQIITAISAFNQQERPVDVLVLTRGGGSVEDLQAFSAETVVRAVATSRIPTLVAIGHERDMSLAELAADVRASTPSNAAELLTPDKQEVKVRLGQYLGMMVYSLQLMHERRLGILQHNRERLDALTQRTVDVAKEKLAAQRAMLIAYNPSYALQRGYALIRKEGRYINQSRQVAIGDVVEVEIADAYLMAQIDRIELKEGDE